MTLVLDTCAVLRLGGELGGLGVKARERIRADSGPLLVSAITAWEIALLVRSGRLELPIGDSNTWFAETCAVRGLREVAVTSGIAMASVALPVIHHDPADRFIVATAMHHRAAVITSDRMIPQYPGVSAIWS